MEIHSNENNKNSKKENKLTLQSKHIKLVPLIPWIPVSHHLSFWCPTHDRRQSEFVPVFFDGKHIDSVKREGGKRPLIHQEG